MKPILSLRIGLFAAAVAFHCIACIPAAVATEPAKQSNTLNNHEGNEWLKIFGVQGYEYTVLTLEPSYGASLRIEVWEPDDADKPSYSLVVGSHAIFPEKTTLSCEYRLFFMPPRLENVVAPESYPAVVHWRVRNSGEVRKGASPGWSGEERLALPENYLGLKRYRLGNAQLYDWRGRNLDEPLPFFDLVVSYGGVRRVPDPEAFRKANPSAVHIIAWFEPIQERPTAAGPEPKAESATKPDDAAKEPTPLEVGQECPEWSMKISDGSELSSSDLLDHVTVLDFWATWCGPCMIELPDLIALQNEYAERGVRFVGFSLDRDFAVKDLARFARWHSINYPVGIAPLALEKAFGGIQAIPTIYIVDREGRIAFGHIGALSKGELKTELDRLLASGPEQQAKQGHQKATSAGARTLRSNGPRL